MRAARPPFVVIHNIPSPYRLHLFRALDDELRRRGLQLHVDFLARSPAGRLHWAEHGTEIPFSHSYWRDIGPTIRRKEWHLNPGLLARLASEPPKYLVVGGPWDSITSAVSSFMTSRSVSVGWFEGNTLTPGRMSGAALYVKRLLLQRFRYIAVPGLEGRRLANLILGRDLGDRLLVLPNLVDETRFRSPALSRQATRLELGIGGEERLAIWPARLIPAKGILPFLSAIEPGDVAGWIIAIVGDGPLSAEVEATIADRGLASSVRTLPSVGYDRMPALYGAADLFLLPSLDDPNPLSVVEAMHAGLPLLVSNRLGNLPEALRPGQNGWQCEPTSPSNVRAAVRAAFGASVATLGQMGQLSRELAADSWATRPAVRRFLDRVLPLARAAEPGSDPSTEPNRGG